MADTFFKITFFATAYTSDPKATSAQDKPVEKTLLTTRISGPEPGYVLTPIALTQAALCLLQNKVMAYFPPDVPFHLYFYL